jgi:hypothetical protein
MPEFHTIKLCQPERNSALPECPNATHTIMKNSGSGTSGVLKIVAEFLTPYFLIGLIFYPDNIIG